MRGGVHFEGKLVFLADDEGEMALVVVEVGFETSDGVVFGEFDDGQVHAEWCGRYA